MVAANSRTLTPCGRSFSYTPENNESPSIGRLCKAGWEVAIASAGSSWYIHRLLERAGVRGVAVHSNPGAIEPGRGLRIRLPSDSPFFSRDVGIDTAAIVRDALERAELAAFAGDGPPPM